MYIFGCGMYWLVNYGTFIIGILFSLYAFCKKFVMIRSDYDSYSNPNTAKAVYELICKNMLFCNKNVIWKNKQCPAGFVMGKGGRFFARVDMYKGRNDMELEIEVYTFRFLKNAIDQQIIGRIAEIEQGSLFEVGGGMGGGRCIEVIPLLYKKDVQHDSCWSTMDIVPFRFYNEVPARSSEVCEAIMGRIERQGYIGGVYMFSGEPGKGKSIAARLLAMKLKGTLCVDFNPSKPAYKLTSVIAACSPSRRTPLVVVIEEVDKVFGRLGAIPDHGTFSIQVKDKDDWNNMLDFVGMASNVVLVLTSNMSMGELKESFDPALVRNYRVTECFTF